MNVIRKSTVVLIIVALLLGAVPSALAQQHGERFMCRYRDNGVVEWAYVVGDDQPDYLANGWVYGLRLAQVWTCPAPTPAPASAALAAPAVAPAAVFPDLYGGDQVLDVFGPFLRITAPVHVYGISAAGDYTADDVAMLITLPRAEWLAVDALSAVLPATALAAGPNYLLAELDDGTLLAAVRVDRGENGAVVVWAAALSDQVQANPLSAVWGS